MEKLKELFNSSNRFIGVYGSDKGYCSEIDHAIATKVGQVLYAIDPQQVIVTGSCSGLPALISQTFHDLNGWTIGISPGKNIDNHIQVYGNPVAPYRNIVDRKSTRLNSSHRTISYAVFCLKKKNRYPAPVEFIAAVIAYYVHPVNIQTACLIMEGAEFTENIINGVERPVKAADLFAITFRVRAGNTDVLTDAEENVRQKLRAEGVM